MGRAGQGPGAAFRLHFRHAKWLYAEAAIGEGRIGCDQIKQRYLPSTKRNRRITREGAIQPCAARHIGYFPVPARTLHQPHRWGIHAMRQGFFQRDFHVVAQIRAAIDI